MKTLVLALAFVSLSTVAFAQALPPPAGYTFEAQVLVSSTNTTRTSPIANVQCNLIAIPASPTPLVNATRIQWDDDVNSLPGAPKVCLGSVGSFFSTLPPASGYIATITVTDTLAVPVFTTARSIGSDPFVAARAQPAVRTGVGVRP